MEDIGSIICCLEKSLNGPTLLMTDAIAALQAMTRVKDFSKILVSYGFYRVIKVLPINALIDLYKCLMITNFVEAGNSVLNEFFLYTQDKGSLAEKAYLSMFFQEIIDNPNDNELQIKNNDTIKELQSRLNARIQEMSNNGQIIEDYVVNETRNNNDFNFEGDGVIKSMKSGFTAENGRIFLLMALLSM